MSKTDRTLSINGVRVPRLLYGTAWKEDETQRLTALALRQGFRGIDTANQRRHYHEAAVGQAIAAAIANGIVTRDDLFLQTKFTFRAGRIIACPTIRPRPSRTRSSSRSPARWNTWASKSSTPSCCMARRSGWSGCGRLGSLASDGTAPRAAAGPDCSESAT